MVRLREHLSYGGLVLAALATVTACHPNAPPVASSVSSPQPQEQAPSVPSAAAPKTVVEPAPSVRQVESAPLDPPWNPVSSGETFNDRPAPTLRDWTSSSGAFHAGAKFAGLVEGQVQLNKAAGGQVLVPLDKLSVNDRKYIKELIRVDPTANVIIGKVFRVMDNRTISVLDEEEYRLVHLEGVGDLDVNQKRASEAKEALSAKILDKFVWVEWREKEKYESVLGQMYLDGRNINLEMVAEGQAPHDRQPRINPRLANAELIARRKRLGLWNDSYADSPFGLGTNR